ncbi:hypothetical protein F4777DRAFT_12939 [Nemania sp. FL0916]|nr:hypothetical protein F4777DRAFT_12939 [Nemania sp. FL0916]
MARRQPRVEPMPPQPLVAADNATVDWAQLCKITAYRILRDGFTIEHLPPMTSVQIGGQLGTGVVLVVSAGSKPVHDVHHVFPGIADGLTDMAQDGLNGGMILYKLSFQFVAAAS